MEARDTIHASSEITWRAKLAPLQGSIAVADIEVRQMASRLMMARCGRSFPPGLPVRIDQHDAILLGEVAACREESPGEFSLLIEMNESLSGLHSLRKLVKALLGEAREGEPSHPGGWAPQQQPGPDAFRRNPIAGRHAEPQHGERRFEASPGEGRQSAATI